jgi:hypothetical protein
MAMGASVVVHVMLGTVAVAAKAAIDVENLADGVVNLTCSVLMVPARATRAVG